MFKMQLARYRLHTDVVKMQVWRKLLPTASLGLLQIKLNFFNNDNPDILKRDPPSRIAVKKFLNKREKLLEEFRQEWYDSYLLSMQTQYKDLHNDQFKNCIIPRIHTPCENHPN